MELSCHFYVRKLMGHGKIEFKCFDPTKISSELSYLLNIKVFSSRDAYHELID